MGGVDALSGFNYQHCHGVLTALEVAADSALAGIRVEGVEDVVDLEVHVASGDGDTRVSRGIQVKSRSAPYKWSKVDLLKVLRRWASLPASIGSEFVFMTDGELGPSACEVVRALESARGGDNHLLAAMLEVEVTDPICEIAGRARVVVEPWTYEARLYEAQAEVRALLESGPNSPDSEQEANNRINGLWRLITTRSGLKRAEERFISREEILEVIGGLRYLPPGDRWAHSLVAEYIKDAVNESVEKVVVPRVRASWSESDLQVDDLRAHDGHLVLAGRTGTGKSTLARLWRVQAAASGSSAIVCHAEGYLARGLDRSVADAVGDVVGRDLSRVVGRHVLGDPQSTIIIDGVSEVPAATRAELAEELRGHLAGGRSARFVLVGRDESICALTFPASESIQRVHPQAFGPDERLELTTCVLAGLPSTGMTERAALARAEHAIGDAAGNPLLLRLALELVASGVDFSDRAEVYQLTVGRMAEGSNAGDVFTASVVLGIIFAKLLNEGKRYANPLEWARLFREAVNELLSEGVAADSAAIEEAVERTGLVNAVVKSAGHRGVRVPVHDSFSDYFAGFAHSEGLVSLPDLLADGDENRVLFASQMRAFSTDQLLLIAEQLPFTMVRLSEADSRPLNSESPRLVAAILKRVLSDVEPIGITMWRDGEDRPLAQVGTSHMGWVETTSAPGIFDGLTIVGDVNDSPVTLAVGLWRLILQQRLRRPEWLRPRSPISQEEGCEQLEVHFTQTCAEGEGLLQLVAPRAATVRLTRMVGPLGGTGVVYPRENGGSRPSRWPVTYRSTACTSFSPAPDHEIDSGASRQDHGSSSTVEYIMSISPERTAAKHITDAINKLTRSHWL